MSEPGPKLPITPPTPSKPVWLDYAREEAGRLRRWATRNFTVENIVSGLKTLAWVAPLTILIWVYAEREQTARIPVTIPIAVKSSDPTRIVRLLTGGQSVTAELTGPRVQVDRVKELLSHPGDAPAVQIEVPRSYTPGQQVTLDTTRTVGDNPLFRSMGVTVYDCKPSTLEIFIDELIEREVEVRVPVEITNLAGPPVFEPRTVKVRGPGAIIKEDTRRGALTVFADLAGRDELRTPGQHDLAAVPLRCSLDDPSITIVPNNVKATLDVSQSDVRFTIKSMPVWPFSPLGLLEKYKVDCPKNITNITVVGPPDKIEMISNNNFAPKAMLDLSSADIDLPMHERQLRFDLPYGVYVSKEDEAKARISFRLVPIE